MSPKHSANATNNAGTQSKSTGTVTGDSKELLQPLIDCFKELHEIMSEELNRDPAPEFTCSQIRDTTVWLRCIVSAMTEHNNGFSKSGLSELSEEALERNQELAREASRQLTLLFADQSKQFSNDKSKYQIAELGKGSQSQEIKGNLQKFMDFLNHFGDEKWLGELVAPEFAEQKGDAVRLLQSLQNPAKMVLPGCAPGQLALYCNQCAQTTTRTLGFCTLCNRCAHGYGKHQYPQGCPSGCNTNQVGAAYCQRCGGTTSRSLGFCTSCKKCAHGYKQKNCPQGCPSGCNTDQIGAVYCPQCGRTAGRSLGFCTSCRQCAHGYTQNQYPRGCPSGCNQQQSPIIEIAEMQATLFDSIPKADRCSSAHLERLAKMATALAAACHEDASSRAKAEKVLDKKIKLLKDFAEAMNEVPEVLRRFLLLRSGSIKCDLKNLKTWISKAEADGAHKQLERFRDEATEEKVMRRLRKNGAYASSLASSWEVASDAAER
eukprot:TRINITY_DN3938_c0_g2_i1.p1 TRINITY_DN3938_c0_g2~~TRINITY_DN3938_c0_g2_i1.p1  ORF type:complete len:490 (+),score=79.12 TRINITY_DN3938_c0_g2_i1:90-1559(+)